MKNAHKAVRVAGDPFRFTGGRATAKEIRGLMHIQEGEEEVEEGKEETEASSLLARYQ